MGKARAALADLRAMPLVFRASLAVLAVAVAIGQLTQRQPAGPRSQEMMIAVAQGCPTAAGPLTGLTVGDAEQALDRALRRMILDRLIPHPLPRCRSALNGHGMQVSPVVRP